MPSLSLLAVFLGTALVITRLPGVFFPREFSKAFKQFLKEETCVRMFSFLLLAVSVAILMQKYDFTKDWETLMSVMGWAMLVATVVFMWWPHFMQKRLVQWLKSEGLVSFACLLKVAFGVLLIYLGFYVY